MRRRRAKSEDGKKRGKPALSGRGPGAIQGVRAGVGERRGARDSRRGRFLPDGSRRAGQNQRIAATERGRSGVRHPTNFGPRRRLDRDRRHPGSGRNQRRPDISILSDEFLAEVRSWKRRTWRWRRAQAAERRNPFAQPDERGRRRKRFSERLEAAIARYHTNAIRHRRGAARADQLAKDVRAARSAAKRRTVAGGNRLLRRSGENESAREVMGNDAESHRPRTDGQPQGQRHGRLVAPRKRAGPDAGTGKAHPPQVRLSARPSRRGGSDGAAAGRGALGQLGVKNSRRPPA